MEFQFNKITPKTFGTIVALHLLGGERCLFSGPLNPPKFPKKTGPGRFRLPLWERMGLGLRGIGTCLQGIHGGGWGFGGRGMRSLYQHLKEKNTLQRYEKHLFLFKWNPFPEKNVFEMFEVFYLYRYIYIHLIKVNSIESTWVTNNGEVGCLWRTGPDSMDSIENAKYVPHQNDMFGFVGNSIRVESERKNLQPEKNNTTFFWISNHGDFLSLTKRKRIKHEQIWCQDQFESLQSLRKESKKSSTCEGSMTSTMSVLDVFQGPLHNQAKLHALNYKGNPAKMTSNMFLIKFVPSQKWVPFKWSR